MIIHSSFIKGVAVSVAVADPMTILALQTLTPFADR